MNIFSTKSLKLIIFWIFSSIRNLFYCFGRKITFIFGTVLDADILLRTKSRILTVGKMKKLVATDILLVYGLQGLICLEQGVSCKNINCFSVINLKFLLDHHDQLENGERFYDQNSAYLHLYLLLSKGFNLEFLLLFNKIGILSG